MSTAETGDPQTGEREAEAHDHQHRDLSGGWLRPAVFGAMDGLVTNISLLAGVGGATTSRHTLVLTGVAGLVAGACSMSIGEYTSVQTQNEALSAEVAKERTEILENREAEEAEFAAMWRGHGLSPDLAAAVSHELMNDTDKAVVLHLREELGLDVNEQPSPYVAAASSFVCFGLGALVPLLPFLFYAATLWVGLAFGAVGLFATGAFVARYTVRSPLANGVRQLLLGGAAAGATYLVGHLIGASTGG